MRICYKGIRARGESIYDEEEGRLVMMRGQKLFQWVRMVCVSHEHYRWQQRRQKEEVFFL